MIPGPDASPRLVRRQRLGPAAAKNHRLRRRASDGSPTSLYSRASISTISSYYEGSFDVGWDSSDELYDVSGSESDQDSTSPRTRRRSDAAAEHHRPKVDRCNDLEIPSPSHWPTIDKFKKSQAVPLTPASTILLSSELLSKLPSHASSSATPSLDGSLSSDQQASLSAPSTPDSVENPADHVDWDRVDIARAGAEYADDAGPLIKVGMDTADLHDSGVQLPTEALDLLQRLHMGFDVPIEIDVPPDAESCEMREVAFVLRDPDKSDHHDHNDDRNLRPDKSVVRAPDRSVLRDPDKNVIREPDKNGGDPSSASTEYSISELSVPSPNGFFSSLEAGSRHTWSTGVSVLVDLPSSTTAEQFYNAPWNQKIFDIKAHVVDIHLGDGDGTDWYTNDTTTAQIQRMPPDRCSDSDSSVSVASSSPPKDRLRELSRRGAIRYSPPYPNPKHPTGVPAIDHSSSFQISTNATGHLADGYSPPHRGPPDAVGNPPLSRHRKDPTGYTSTAHAPPCDISKDLMQLATGRNSPPDKHTEGLVDCATDRHSPPYHNPKDPIDWLMRVQSPPYWDPNTLAVFDRDGHTPLYCEHPNPTGLIAVGHSPPRHGPGDSIVDRPPPPLRQLDDPISVAGAGCSPPLHTLPDQSRATRFVHEPLGDEMRIQSATNGRFLLSSRNSQDSNGPISSIASRRSPFNSETFQVIELSSIRSPCAELDDRTALGASRLSPPFYAVNPPIGLAAPMQSPPQSETNQPVGLAEIDEQLRLAANSAFTRTVQWAIAQNEVLHELAGKDPPSSPTAVLGITNRDASPSPEASPGRRKKSVRFVDTERANAATKDESGDSLFYHAFQTLSNQSSPTDSFVHRHERFDAVQALRSTLRDAHIDSLLGHYVTVDPPNRSMPRPISMMPGAKEDSEEHEVQAQKEALAQRERERQALEQVAPAMWIVEGMRFLAGGRLLNSPAGDILSRAAAPLPMGSRAPPPAATRVLDLGGQPQCDWAWFCAREYPNVRTYTATCDSRAVNSTLRGPRNHRLVHVEKLYKLPFPDNFFDVVSARSLHHFLRAVPTSGTAATDESSIDPTRDEYDACLTECLRVLKPGGFLEYFLLDAELAQPGPKGEAASVEFAVNLKRSGYDPTPTRAWLRRIRQTGFIGIKRAWMFLPLGAIRPPDNRMPETPPPPKLPPDRGSSAAARRSEGDEPGGRPSCASDGSSAPSTRTSSSSNTSSSGESGTTFSSRTSSLPAGAPSAKRGTVGAVVADFKYEGDRPVEAVRGPIGSGIDAAHISGLVGSCLWERWMLKLQMEMGREVGLLDGVGAVVEEGRHTGAGWRCLSGWARKPLASLKTTF